jgi:hypothetical protein
VIRIRTAPGEAERALFVGVTRSGKTCLVQALLCELGSWVVFDSKRVGREWQDFAEARGAVVTENPADIRRHERVVFRVDLRSLQDREGWRREGTLGWLWTEALLSCFWRQSDDGSTVVDFNEAMHTLPASGGHPDARRLATQGAGMGLPVFVETQAPLYIDTVTMAQAEHCFAWALHHPKYRKELMDRRGVDCEVLAHLAGPKDPDVTRRHEFAHHFTGDPDWSLFEPIRLARGSYRVKPVTESERAISQEPPPDGDTVTLQPQEAAATVPAEWSRSAPTT